MSKYRIVKYLERERHNNDRYASLANDCYRVFKKGFWGWYLLRDTWYTLESARHAVNTDKNECVIVEEYD